MSLLEQLKKERIEAMKTHYKAKVDLLGVILGEATKATKEPSDDVLLKTIKNNITTSQELIGMVNKQLQLPSGDPDAIEDMHESIIAAKNEISILQSYLPTEVSVFEIRTFIDERKAAGDDFGKIMKATKLKFGQSVDMKLVGQMAKE